MKTLIRNELRHFWLILIGDFNCPVAELNNNFKRIAVWYNQKHWYWFNFKVIV